MTGTGDARGFDDRGLVEYLLGRSTEAGRSAIEERLVTQDGFEEELLSATDELIEAYLKGALASEDRARFARHFLSLRRHQQRLAFLRDLGSAVEQLAREGVPSLGRTPGVVRRRSPISSLLTGLAASAAVLAMAAGLWLGPRARHHGTAGAGPSLAVLPFLDASPAKDQEYLADGLSEELLNALARTAGLRVAARASAFQFKGKPADVAAIGKRLGVGAILEGSLRRSDNRVQLTAHLVNVADGLHLWSQTYDRDLNDLPAIQEEVALAVTAALEVPAPAAAKPPPLDPGGRASALVLYFQGRHFALRRTAEHLKLAIEYYRRALEADPEFATAWVGMADARVSQAGRGYAPVAEAFPEARRELARALSLDPRLADAHAVMGTIRRTHEWDWEGANADCQRAVELEPGNARALLCAARVAGTLARFEESIRLYRRILRIDPLSVNIRFVLGGMELAVGRQREAEAAFREALALNPAYPGCHFGLGLIELLRSRPDAALLEMEREPESIWRRQGLALAYTALGRAREADAALARLIESDARDYAIQIAAVYAFRGEADDALRWLERAYAQRDPGLADLKGYPLFTPLERDPRYQALLARLKLPL